MKSTTKYVLSVLILTQTLSVYGTGLLTFDAGQLIVALQEYLLQTAQNEIENEFSELGIETMNEISQNEQASDENIAANTIARITQSAYDINNQQALVDSKPAFTACSAFSQAKAIQKTAPAKNAAIEAAQTQFIQRELASDQTQSQHEKAIDSELVSRFYASQSDYPDMLKADLFLQVGEFDNAAYTSEQLGAVSDFITLLNGPYREQTFTEKANIQENPDTRNRFVQNLQTIARKNFSHAMLQNFAASYTPNGNNGVSEMSILRQFVEDRFGNPDYIARITNTSPAAKSNPVQTTELLREMTISQAALVKIDHLIMNSQRRNEIANATLLAIANARSTSSRPEMTR